MREQTLPEINLKPGKRETLPCLCILLLAVLSSCLWQINLWQHVPGFTNSAYGDLVFYAENATQYRYARMVAQKGSIPEIDRYLQYPEGVKPLEEFATAKEYFQGTIYRLLQPKMSFQQFLPLVMVPFFGLSILACYYAGILVWKRHLAALLGAIYYAAYLPAFRRTIGSYSDEHFALPFIFFGICFLVSSARHLEKQSRSLRGWLLTVPAGCCWVTALMSWHFSRFVLLLVCAGILLYLLAKPFAKGWSLASAGILPWLLAASLFFQMLLAQKFIFSYQMLFIILIALFAFLPANFSAGRRRALLIATSVFILFIAGRVEGAGSYPFITKILFAKIRYGMHKPLDPSLLDFSVRLIWQEAFRSPDLYILLYRKLQILFLAAICFFIVLRKGLLDHVPGWLTYMTIVMLAAFAMFYRLDILACFFQVLWFGALLLYTGWRRALLLTVFFCCWSLELLKSYHYKKLDKLRQVISKIAPRAEENRIFGLVYEFKRLHRWIKLKSKPEKSWAGQFKFMPGILLHSERPIAIHAKQSSKGIWEKTKSFYYALYDSEQQFYAWCKKNEVSYILLEPEILLARGVSSPLYIAGKTEIKPQMAAYKLHFFPENLQHFTLRYQNSRFRVYQVLPTKKNYEQEKNFPLQPWFDPVFFQASPEKVPTEERFNYCTNTLLKAEEEMAYGLSAFRRKENNLAGKLLLKALRAHPGLPQLRPLLAKIFLQMRQPEAALQLAKSGTVYEPETAESWYILGRTLLVTGNKSEAYKSFDLALNYNPGKLKADILHYKKMAEK